MKRNQSLKAGANSQELHDRARTRRIIVYVKRPLAGYAKTRLAAGIGAEAAAGVYARLLYGYLAELLRAPVPGAQVEIAAASPEDAEYFRHAYPEWPVVAQVAGDLGTRMAASFRQAFAAGAKSVILTGSDAPDVNAALLTEAFYTLEATRETKQDSTPRGIIGPTVDGGYYLIGMRAPGANVFEGVTWSTDRVLAQTEALALAAGMTLVRLPKLADIDRAEDYEAWRLRRMEGEEAGSEPASP